MRADSAPGKVASQRRNITKDGMTDTTIITDTLAGPIRGTIHRGVHRYLGIPYALPPLGDLRFKATQAVGKWGGVFDATKEPTIAPQTPSRVAAVIGDFSGPQSEDCLNLCVYTPSADDTKRPVIVWIHGGAYSTGAGSLQCHSGEALARAENVVVVSVNFRLGALGFLYLPGVSDGNLGLLDQIEALRWIKQNIQALGGDPQNITLAGQSSGASAITSLTLMPEARGLFNRIILQSAPLGRPERTPSEAAKLGQLFLGHAGLHQENSADLKTLPVEKIIAAQTAYARALSAPLGATALPFMPVTDGKRLLSLKESGPGKADIGCDAIVGTTREEMAAFYATDQRVKNATGDEVIEAFASTLGKPNAQTLYADYAKRRASTSPAAILGDIYTDRTFRSGSMELAQRYSAAGYSVYVYRFDWQSPAGLAACHCLDIPFVFNNLSDWAGSPMLEGVDEGTFIGLSRKIQRAWAAFAANGDPNHENMPRWEAFSSGSNQMMKFDSVLESATIDLTALDL